MLPNLSYWATQIINLGDHIWLAFFVAAVPIIGVVDAYGTILCHFVYNTLDPSILVYALYF